MLALLHLYHSVSIVHAFSNKVRLLLKVVHISGGGGGGVRTGSPLGTQSQPQDIWFCANVKNLPKHMVHT